MMNEEWWYQSNYTLTQDEL